jgi:DNA-binding beta-propeller fold protein YncE
MRLLLGVLCLVLGSELQAQATQYSLWVTLGESDQLVEVNATTFEVIRRIKVDRGVHGLAPTADGTKIYVASDRTGMFQVVDAKRGTVVGQIMLGSDPNQMTLSRDERFAYVPMRGESKVAVVQLNPLRLIKKLDVPLGPHDAYTTVDGRIYVGAQYGTGIAVIDPATQTVSHVIPTEAGVRPIRPSADGKTLYVALSNLLGFVVVDVEARKVTRRVSLGTLPEGMPQPYKDTWTHDLALSPDGKELWISDDINDLLRVVRLSDMKEVAQLRTGHFPHWFATHPDGKTMFASLWFSDAVAVVDLATKKIVRNIQFERGTGPKRIAVAPRAPNR